VAAAGRCCARRATWNRIAKVKKESTQQTNTPSCHISRRLAKARHLCSMTACRGRGEVVGGRGGRWRRSGAPARPPTHGFTLAGWVQPAGRCAHLHHGQPKGRQVQRSDLPALEQRLQQQGARVSAVSGLPAGACACRAPLRLPTMGPRHPTAPPRLYEAVLVGVGSALDIHHKRLHHHLVAPT
jgi:hypothetical protein